MSAEPTAAPPMLPRPPSTTATTSSSENASVYAPGLTDCVTKQSTAPPAPAATELRVNAVTLTRPVAHAVQPRGGLVVADGAHAQAEPAAASRRRAR